MFPARGSEGTTLARKGPLFPVPTLTFSPPTSPALVLTLSPMRLALLTALLAGGLVATQLSDNVPCTFYQLPTCSCAVECFGGTATGYATADIGCVCRSRNAQTAIFNCPQRACSSATFNSSESLFQGICAAIARLLLACVRLLLPAPATQSALSSGTITTSSVLCVQVIHVREQGPESSQRRSSPPSSSSHPRLNLRHRRPIALSFLLPTAVFLA